MLVRAEVRDRRRAGRRQPRPDARAGRSRWAAPRRGCWAASQFVVGRDTRRSGPLLESALIAGLTSEGAQVTTLGVVPTPAVAWLAAAEGAAGAVISASHNRVRGQRHQAVRRRWPQAHRRRRDGARGGAARAPRPRGRRLGPHRRRRRHGRRRIRRRSSRWADSVLAIDRRSRPRGDVAGGRLRQRRRHRGGAQGAAGPRRDGGGPPRRARRHEHQRRLRVDLPGGPAEGGGRSAAPTSGSPSTATPTGCSRSTPTAGSSTATRSSPSRAIDRRDRGRLAEDTVVATVMTNLGFRLACASTASRSLEIPVGDRYVLEALADERLVPRRRAERPRHLRRPRHHRRRPAHRACSCSTPSAAPGGRSAELADAAMTRLPQVLRNVRVAGKGIDLAGAARRGRSPRWRPSSATTGRVLVRGERHRAARAGDGRGAHRGGGRGGRAARAGRARRSRPSGAA